MKVIINSHSLNPQENVSGISSVTQFIIFKNKYVNNTVMFIGGLCLEIYLIQIPLLKINLGLPFPINYVTMFALIIVSAYVLRCCARIFTQTFNKQDYNWKEVFKLL